ncbi:MAG: hypothetical protein K8T89_02285 [Planctomycetes bacterium]|nr:hypothetical protein [Planctomycetota bacterium]
MSIVLKHQLQLPIFDDYANERANSDQQERCYYRSSAREEEPRSLLDLGIVPSPFGFHAEFRP